MISYGRIEVKRALPKNLMEALVISIVLHFLVIGSYYTERYLSKEEEAPIVGVRIMKYSELGPPPSILSTPPATAVGIAVAAARPTIGIPVPVPDIEVNPEQTIASQKELSATTGPYSEGGTGTGRIGTDAGQNILSSEDIKIEVDEPDINAFIPVEKPPQIVKEVSPVYPEIARRSGVEGVVWVKVLIDKNGKPKKAVVIKENANGILDQAAIDATMQHLFTPAVMNGGAVQVWVALKFRFQLKQAL